MSVFRHEVWEPLVLRWRPPAGILRAAPRPRIKVERALRRIHFNFGRNVLRAQHTRRKADCTQVTADGNISTVIRTIA